jgi:multidrug efflux pump
MKFTDIFIRRPVLAIVVSLVIIIAGLQSISSLNVRQYPKSENASVTVTTAYIGADADLVRGFITVPLERTIAAADGIDYIESTSAQSLSTITAHLKLNYDATKALSEISSKVDQVRNDLPPEAEVPIINIVSSDSEFASAYLSFSSDLIKPNEITDYLVRVVQPKLTAIPGVQKADILGGRTYAMRIWLQPDKMAALNISPSQVYRALKQNNYLSALGNTKGNMVQINLASDTDLHSVDEFEKLVVAEIDGKLIRLESIARIVLGADDYSNEVRFTGQTAVFIGVWVLPNANSIDVIKAVQKEIKRLQSELPKGLNARVAYDATEYINDAIIEVIKTLTETLLIVVVVIFLFLGSVRSVIVPVIAIPVSLIGAVFLMQVFGFTVNLLTLLAIVLSVGLVVDDAIVIVENVERYLRNGHSPFDAAIHGARELIGPVISMTVTLAAVYAPIGLQGGLTGSLFREFAFTLAGAVTISGIVALTLSPFMSSKLLNKDVEEHGLPLRINRMFDRVREAYGRILDKTLAARPAIYIIWLGLSLLAVLMYQQSAKELAPTEDQGIIFGIVDAPANTTLESSSAATRAAFNIFEKTPEMAHTFQITFPSGGFGGMIVDPWGERKRTVFEILPEVQQQLAQLPSIRQFPVLPPALPGGGQFPVEFVIASTAEPEVILDFAQQLQAKAAQSGLFAFPPIIDTRIDSPQSKLSIDKDKVATLGLDLTTVGNDISIMTGGNYVNRFNIEGRSYKVIPQIERSERLNPEQLLDIHVSGPDGKLIPLSNIASITQSTQPRQLNRFQQLNSVKLSGVAIQSLDTVLTYLETEAASILPQGFVIDYTGESRQLRKEANNFLMTMGLSVILIFLVLAAQFNSFRDPLIILLGSVPLAMFGSLIFTFLKMPNPNIPFWTDGWTTTMNIYSQVGLVTLVGLVSKNGILIVEFANVLQREGLNKLEAIKQAARTRLRPILMTTMATVFGHLPLVFVTGAGAEARNSIGLVIVMGMSIGTIFTLFVVPSIYMLIAKDHRKDSLETQPLKD